MTSLSYMIQGFTTALAALFAVESANALDEFEDNITKSFEVSAGGQLTLETNRGSIEVRAVDSDGLEIEVIRKVKARNRKKADEILRDFEIEYTQRGNDVYVHAEVKRDWRSFWGLRRRLELCYLVSVPRKYSVDLRTSGGRISVDDLEGEVRGRTSGGSLHFGTIQGPVHGSTSGGSIVLAGCMGMVKAETSGGSIKIGEVEGDISARTSGGSIHIDRAKGGVAARTSGGSITVEELRGAIEATTSGGTVTARMFEQPQADSHMKTSGGKVVVYLADTIAVDVDARTTGGRVRTEIPVTVQGELSKNALQAEINGGGPKLILHTSGGSIYLHKLEIPE